MMENMIGTTESLDDVLIDRADMLLIILSHKKSSQRTRFSIGVSFIQIEKQEKLEAEAAAAATEQQYQPQEWGGAAIDTDGKQVDDWGAEPAAGASTTDWGAEPTVAAAAPAAAAPPGLPPMTFGADVGAGTSAGTSDWAAAAEDGEKWGGAKPDWSQKGRGVTSRFGIQNAFMFFLCPCFESLICLRKNDFFQNCPRTQFIQSYVFLGK